jgi:hypothetical protein
VTVSDDGSQELEVLYNGPPHRTEDTIDQRKFSREPDATPTRTLAITSQAGLQQAVNLIRAALLDATALDGGAGEMPLPPATRNRRTPRGVRSPSASPRTRCGTCVYAHLSSSISLRADPAQPHPQASQCPASLISRDSAV